MLKKGVFCVSQSTKVTDMASVFQSRSAPAKEVWPLCLLASAKMGVASEILCSSSVAVASLPLDRSDCGFGLSSNPVKKGVASLSLGPSDGGFGLLSVPVKEGVAAQNASRAACQIRTLATGLRHCSD